MTLEQYQAKCQELMAEASFQEQSKRPAYTQGSDDVLANFKRIADRTGLTPGQVWSVYFLKHIDAVTVALTKPDVSQSEAILGRFADALNYLKLGYALLQDVHEQEIEEYCEACFHAPTCEQKVEDARKAVEMGDRLGSSFLVMTEEDIVKDLNTLLELLKR